MAKGYGAHSGARYRMLGIGALAAAAILWTSAAKATITQGDFSVFGFFETREGGQWGEGSAVNNGTNSTFSVGPGGTASVVPGVAATETGGSFDFNHWDLNEMRQLADIRPDYHVVKNYKLLGRFDTLILKDADFFAFYRPWYDAEGTLKNKGTAEPNRDFANYTHEELQQEYFKDDLREYYGQLNFTDNFSVRIGKQQIIWSEADALSGTEVTNVVNATWHGVYGAESPEDQRTNVQMIKANYILPDFLKTANNEVEAFIIPGDLQAQNGPAINVQEDSRNPWVVPSTLTLGGTLYNQNGQPYRAQYLGNANLGYAGSGGGGMFFFGAPFNFADLATDTGNPYLNMSKLPSRSLENSEFGFRASSLLPIGDGLQASFIYLYEYRDDNLNVNCGNCTAQQAITALGPNAAGINPGTVVKIAPGEFYIPGAYQFGQPLPGVPKTGTFAITSETDWRRNNFFGLTGTYYDKALTDVVYRYDVLWEPRYGGAGTATSPLGSVNTERARFIIAGDRPTYIPWISKQHTFLTAQYVNTWFPDRPTNATSFPTAGKLRQNTNFAFLSSVNWLMNGQLTSGNVFQWDIDDNVGALASNNTFRYSRNILFGANTIWFLGRSGRNTDPFLYSRSQRTNLLEFTLTYEI